MEFEDLITIIDDNVNIQETVDIEFKSAKGGFPGSFWETYSSFANTEGGMIVLGVAEKKGKFYIDGLSIEDTQKYKKDFWDNSHNKNTINECLLTDADVKEVSIDGKWILLFRIRQAERAQRPIHRGLDPYNGTYKRNHEGDYKCDRDEVRRMIADADINRPSDSRILRNFSIDDIDLPSLNQFRRLFAISKPDHPWLALDDIELLRMLGGYRKDRVTKEEGFTLAGLLMFGKTQSINDPECAPHFFPDYRLYSSEKPEGNERWIDRIYPDGTWEGNLFQFYRRVLPKLTSVLPTPFKIDEDTRMDETTAHVAIREALINACIHADYTVNASLVISQYPHHIILSNPGTLLITRWQYYRGGESVCRNASLQKIFTMFGKAEKAGSGAGKILQGWKDNNWKRPYLHIVNKPDKVELHLFLESLLPEAHKNRLHEIFGPDCQKWDSDKYLIMAMACTKEEISNESLQFVLPNHRADITQLLRELKSDGLLQSDGYGRGTRYHIPEHLLKTFNSQSTEANNGRTEANNGSTEANNGSTEANNGGSEDTSRRLSPGERMQSIQEFCNGVYRSTAEIAQHIHLSIDYVQRKFISNMVKDGILILLYPDKGTHPYQKYTTVK